MAGNRYLCLIRSDKNLISQT